MTNVVSIDCTCEYLVKRAARHRRACRYDEAMALLWKARNQFGWSDEVLFEMANVYDAIGCEEDLVRTCLRLVRLGGKHSDWALFHLVMSSAQHGDMLRALSYYERLSGIDHPEEISSEMIDALGEQLREENLKGALSARKRAAALEKHAAACLQAGKAAAAQRAMEHALRLRPTARGYTMLACCQMIRSRFEDAVMSAQAAHDMAPSNVQNLCVLADTHMACGNTQQSRRTIFLAALRARSVDDLLAVAVESIKLGDDRLTLLLTGRILKAAPYHTRAMMIRACAYINCSAYDKARRLIGRLCGLLPENTVCEGFYRTLCDEKTISERLTLGLDVTHEEGVNRASELVSMLYMDPKLIDEDRSLCMRICRLCDWAFHSPMAGASTKTIALMILAALQAQEAKDVLIDSLMDQQLSDAFKLKVLQILTAENGFHPYDVDMGGRLVRLAAGAVSETPVRTVDANPRIVQRVAESLSLRNPKEYALILEIYLAYLSQYGEPEHRYEDACTAALEYYYRTHVGKKPKECTIAARYSVSARMMRRFVQRFESCMQKKEQPQQGES